MQDTRLVAEFAIRDVNWLPGQFTGPSRWSAPYVEAANEDLGAWYCWNPLMPNPAPDFQPGNYFVPAWDFGTIPPGQSATRQIYFGIPAGLPPSDPQYPAIIESWPKQTDILLNRTTSLKVSTWIDDPARDTGYAYPEAPLRGSDASVFFNRREEEEEEEEEEGERVWSPDGSRPVNHVPPATGRDAAGTPVRQRRSAH